MINRKRHRANQHKGLLFIDGLTTLSDAAAKAMLKEKRLAELLLEKL